MRLDNRITKLENATAPKQRHVFQCITEDQTEQEALEQYCAKKELDPERFRNEGYGPYLVIKRTIVSPKKPDGREHDD